MAVEGKELTEKDWVSAKAHFDDTLKVYRDLEGTPGCNTTLAIHAVFAPLQRRYDDGERTHDLYRDLLAVE